MVMKKKSKKTPRLSEVELEQLFRLYLERGYDESPAPRLFVRDYDIYFGWPNNHIRVLKFDEDLVPGFSLDAQSEMLATIAQFVMQGVNAP